MNRQTTSTILFALLSLSAFESVSGGSPEPLPTSKPSWKPGDPMAFADGLVVFDAQIRERYEYRDNWFDFTDLADTRDDSALLQRIRFGVKITPADFLELYGQLQSSITVGDDPMSAATREFNTFDNPINLSQAYALIRPPDYPDFFIKGGRQVLAYGDERLVGGFDWDNNSRVFDGARVGYKNGPWSVEWFGAFVVLQNTSGFNNPDTSDFFTGIYSTYKPTPTTTHDFYVFFRDKSKVTPSNVFTNANIRSDGNIAPAGDYATIGTRWVTSPPALKNWDFGLEAAFQCGNIVNPTGFGPVVAGNRINTARQDFVAGAIHLEAGYRVEEWIGKPRFYTEYNFASGDSNPDDQISTTFQNLFPTNHKFYGYMDRFSWQNMHNLANGVILTPAKDLKVRLDAHHFWLAQTEDVWRSGLQAPVGGATRYGNALNNQPGAYVGAEVDLTVYYQLNRWCKLEAGYSHFFPAAYIEGTQAPGLGTDGADFVYGQITLNF